MTIKFNKKGKDFPSVLGISKERADEIFSETVVSLFSTRTNLLTEAAENVIKKLNIEKAEEIFLLGIYISNINSLG